MEFMEGELDVNDQKMYKLLGLDVLDEKKARVDPSTFKLPKASRPLKSPPACQNCEPL
jgi:hypothetical protein